MHSASDPQTASARLDLRRCVARLATAVVVADGRVTADEIDHLAVLDQLGLGAITPLLGEEIDRATVAPVAIDGACAALRAAGPAVATIALSALLDLASADRGPGAATRAVLETIAQGLTDGPATRPAPSPTAAPPPPTAASEDVPRLRMTPPASEAADPFAALGLSPGASAAAVDAAYLALVARYDPANVAALGADFVALAVRKLASITDQYDALRRGAS